MGETGSSGGRSGRPVKNQVKVIHADDDHEELDAGAGSRTKGGHPGTVVKQVLTAEFMGIDGVVHVLGSLKLSDASNRNSRSTGIVAQESDRSQDGSMEAAVTSSSDEGDEGDDISDQESAGGQQDISTTLSREDSALLAELMEVIKRGGELKKLRVDHLKAYLRHHGLRISGLKDVLLSRIEEHLKIKDGQGEVLYPKSSFSINCKGDVCLGDIVLFSQMVYDSYDFVKRNSGPPLGTRLVAGRVVNESYGAEKQQHTFTIEVLWSTGTNPFYVMRPLQIKGRNLYRMHTSRQPWIDEEDRKKVLAEKHARGAEARSKRRAVTGSREPGRSRSKPGSRGQTTTREASRSRPSAMPSIQQERVKHTQHNNIYGGNTASSSSSSSSSSSYAGYHPAEASAVPALHNLTRIHSQQNGSSTTASSQSRQSDKVSPLTWRDEQGIVQRACSNHASGCVKAGAKHCITQSCAPCCFKNGSTRGSCPRHIV